MVYSGTTVVRGSAKAVVVSTGMETEFGKIASLVQTVKQEKIPLQQKLDDFAKKISIFVIALCFIIFFIGISFGISKIVMLFTSISMAVAAVPEGLPAVITICLAIAVRRMERVNSLIRKLPAAETLGRITVIATDKTGTITEEKMHVVKLFYNDKFEEIDELKNELKSKNKKLDEELDILLKIGVLCNNARVEKINNDFYFVGDPTEQALLRTAAEFGYNKAELEKKEPKVKEFSFTSARKLMSVIRQNKRGLVSYVKGAPEVVVARCKYELIKGKSYRLDERRKAQLIEFYQMLAKEGLRVLAFAFKRLNKKELKQEEVESRLVFVGLQAMLDVPRPEVKNAIKECQKAGIAVKMITGDSLLTAVAVAKKIGLKGEAIEGKELEKMSDEDLAEKLKQVGIFARVGPEEKLRIINVLKKQNEIVAVTGDGVNDAPALKRADIGIAMGIRGSDVARDVSDMVLVDDNFASIVKAVKEGRRVFDNIKKFSYYLFSSNLAELFIIIFGLLLASKLGLQTMLLLLPLQILWVNLVTDGIIAITLSLEHPEADIMERKPQQSKLFTLNIVIVWILLAIIVALGSFLLFKILDVEDAIKLQTITFTSLVFFEAFNALNFRSFKQPLYKLKQNYWLLVAIFITFALQILILQIKPFNIVFNVKPLKLTEIILIVAVAVSILIFGEIFKVVRSNLKKENKKKQK